MAITLDGTVGVTSPDFIPSSSNIPTNGLFLPAANTVGLATGSTERLRIDSSGNLGLGVTPSAWGTAYRTAMQIGSAACFAGVSGVGASDYFAVGGNFYLDSGAGYKYIRSTTANRLEASAGEFRWYTAPSGTAGNAISFTQAMTLDASGNLGIGTSSPQARLQITDASGANGTIWLGTATYYGTIQHEAAVTGANIYTVASASGGGHIFKRGSTEQMRLDSSGNLLVGTTSNITTTNRLVVQTATDAQLAINCSNSSAGYSTLTFASQGTSKAQMYWYQGNTNLYVNNGTGGVYMATNGTAWNANSDERLKDIIEPITNAVSKVSSLRAVIGKYKTDEEGTRKPFLIAQDVEIALPEAVTRAKLPRSEDETEYLGIAYTDTIPLLVAAIKELTARLEALEAK